MKKSIIAVAAMFATLSAQAQQNVQDKTTNKQQAEQMVDSLVNNFKQMAEKTLSVSFLVADSLRSRAIDYISAADKISQESTAIADSITARTAQLLSQTQKELSALRDSIIAEAERKKR